MQHLSSFDDEAERLRRRDRWEHAIVRLDSGAMKSNPAVPDLTADRD
jgi:hypothetical protein